MTHSNTELLIDYWQSRVLNGQAPARASINPADFPLLLPQVFILGRRGAGDYGVRLAGNLIRDLHDRDLRGVNYASLWTNISRLPLQTAIERARRLVRPIQMHARASAGAKSVEIEICMAPLASNDGEVDRIIGLYQPLAHLSRLEKQPVESLSLLGIDATSEVAPYIRLAVVGGQKVG